MAEPTKKPQRVVDIHTHFYSPEYWKMLESRTSIPVVRRFQGESQPRIVLLSSEQELLDKAGKDGSPLPGRPLTDHFYDIDQKMHFMDTNGIDVSVISLANPWLDFLDPSESGAMAVTINNGFSDMCSKHPGRLFFFAVLPVTAPLETVLTAIKHIEGLPYGRGIILGSTGLGAGLDDPALLPIFEALAAAGLMIFLHPHYGLPNEVWGPRASAEYGHVLPLALGFPMETTIAVARMYLAGVFDRVPSLRVLLAHSGGTLPFLAGRIESCIRHDGQLAARWKAGEDGGKGRRRRTIWEVLREQVYLDAVIYSKEGLAAAVAASGADRLMFGTDHPFFPPLENDGQGVWESTASNAAAVTEALGEGTPESAGVMGGNAIRVLRLDGKE